MSDLTIPLATEEDLRQAMLAEMEESEASDPAGYDPQLLEAILSPPSSSPAPDQPRGNPAPPQPVRELPQQAVTAPPPLPPQPALTAHAPQPASYPPPVIPDKSGFVSKTLLDKLEQLVKRHPSTYLSVCYEKPIPDKYTGLVAISWRVVPSHAHRLAASIRAMTKLDARFRSLGQDLEQGILPESLLQKAERSKDFQGLSERDRVDKLIDLGNQELFDIANRFHSRSERFREQFEGMISDIMLFQAENVAPNDDSFVTAAALKEDHDFHDYFSWEVGKIILEMICNETRDLVRKRDAKRRHAAALKAKAVSAPTAMDTTDAGEGGNPDPAPAGNEAAPSAPNPVAANQPIPFTLENIQRVFGLAPQLSGSGPAPSAPASANQPLTTAPPMANAPPQNPQGPSRSNNHRKRRRTSSTTSGRSRADNVQQDSANGPAKGPRNQPKGSGSGKPPAKRQKNQTQNPKPNPKPPKTKTSRNPQKNVAGPSKGPEKSKKKRQQPFRKAP